MNKEKIKLSVPLFKQKNRDMACGFVCLQMVLAYYGKILTYKEIINLAKLDPYMGSWFVQMACVALDLGFKTELVNYDLSDIYDADIANLRGNKLIGRLKKQKRKIKKIFYPAIKYNIEMIKKNGKLILKISTKEDLIAWLKKEIPPILTIKIGPAYGEVPSKARRKVLDHHAIVIYGYDGKNFLIHDPHPGKYAIERLPEDLLIYSWHEAQAYALLIYK